METSKNVVPALKGLMKGLSHNWLPPEDSLGQETQWIKDAMNETVVDLLANDWLRPVTIELKKSLWTQRWLILRILVEDIDDKNIWDLKSKLQASIKEFDPESRIRAVKISPMNARHLAGAIMAAEAVRIERRHHDSATHESSSLLPQT